MATLTPLVQPLSIDEAVLDLAGTEALHGAPPAVVLARFAREVERQVGVTVSIGLAANRLLAKIAADRDKPRGFAVIGAGEAASLLAPEPVRLLPGIGPALARRLAARRASPCSAISQALERPRARRRLGEDGPALAARARGEDSRAVDPDAGDQVDQRGDHLRCRPDAARRPGAPSLAAVRRSWPAAEGARAGRRRRGAEAQDRRTSPSAPGRRACPARRCCPTGCSMPPQRCWRARPTAPRSA